MGFDRRPIALNKRLHMRPEVVSWRMTARALAEQNLILRSPDPLNAETAPDNLIASFLTSQAHFYIRSHGPTPELADDHRGALRSNRSTALLRCCRTSGYISDPDCDGNDAVRG
ncbi:hypothetical protein [Sphingomonas nostoxanthinifaciens]|uniref:hypothetical protein n=1 Tax=Sphingomonas nostoxanthinifaciens TaxID=2872652 RepID=UPI001CC21CC0|nr:hypothetical protein [Sphingomonas nostoxanthinifaciens]